MKKIFLIALFLLSNFLIAQNKIDLISTDISNYPNIQIEFMAFDASGMPITNINTSEIVLKDNELIISTDELICGQSESITPDNLIISIDLAMKADSERQHFAIGKSIAEEMINYYDNGQTQIALTAFNHLNYLLNNFSTDNLDLITAIDRAKSAKVSFLESAFIDRPAGAFVLSDSVPLKDFIIITDSKSNFDYDLLEAGLISRNMRLHCFYLGDKAPEELVQLVKSTGGIIEENITLESDVELEVNSLLKRLEGYSPCTLKWGGVISCVDEHLIQISIPKISVNTSFSYKFEAEQKPYFEAEPPYLGYSSVEIGESKYLDITVIARNTDIFVEEFIIADTRFSIIQGNNTNFTINKDNFHNLRIEYTPTDSAIVFTELEIKSQACEGKSIYITAGFPNTPPKTKTIKLLNPTCRETLIVGDTTLIEWVGLLPSDVVHLEYSIDNGENWDSLAVNYTGLSLEWIVPDLPSEECLIKITQLWPNNVGPTIALHHQHKVNSAFFNKDGSKVVTASSDATVAVWNSINGQKLLTLKGHLDEVHYAVFSPNEENIVSAGADNKAIVWNSEIGDIVAELNHEAGVTSVNYSNNGQLIVSTDRRGKTKLWRTTNYSEVMELNSNSGGITRFAEFSPDDSRLITGGYGDGKVKIWDWQNKKIEKEFDTKFGDPSGQVMHATYNYNGSKIAATNNFNYKVSVWDVASSDTLFCVSHADETQKVEINSSSFYFNVNVGELLMTSGINDNASRLWDVDTGEPVFPFVLDDEHTNGVTTSVFNFDASRVLTASWDSTAKIWNRDQNFLQIDTTDCPFVIAYAKAHADEVVFGDVIVNNYKDSIIKHFLINDSKFSFDIEKVYIAGEHASDFNILQSDYYPFALDSADSVPIEIRFAPSSIGERKANIIILYQGDSLNYPLSGFGIEQGIIAATNLIDFGNVEIGDLMQLTFDIMVTNRGAVSYSIDSIYIEGTYKEDFAIIAGADTQELLPGQSKGISLRFTPNLLGLKNAQLIYSHDGQSSPLKINLIGYGIQNILDSLTIAVASGRGKPGDIIEIPITLENLSPEALNNYQGLTTYIDYNATILEPIEFDYISDEIQNEWRHMKISLPFNDMNGNILKTLKFRVGLGNDSTTAINLKHTELNGLNKIVINEISGQVSVDGICNDGGLRLFYSNGELLLEQNIPNPAVNNTTVNFEIIENGQTSLFITDMTGANIATIVNENLKQGTYSYSINTSEFAPGVYYYILQTPTQRITKKMLIK